MSRELNDLSRDALRDLGSVRDLGGHTEMTRDELIAALDGPVPDGIAEWLGRTRQDIYEAAKRAGISGAMDMGKRDLILALADRE